MESASHSKAPHGQSTRRGGKANTRGHGRSKNMPGNDGRGTESAPRGPLTHFLCMPLGHHADLRERVSAFTGDLLASSSVAGLDTSIIIPTRRLHLTLGVMSLAPAQNGQANHEVAVHDGQTLKTVDSAVELLNNLKPQFMQLIGERPFLVPLDRMDIMRPDRGDPENAHVMWLGPDIQSAEGQRLKKVCTFLNKEFIKAGLVIDEKRPLKLHCTVINSTYRRPRSYPRKPFSFPSIVSSNAFKAISLDAPSSASTLPKASTPAATISADQVTRTLEESPAKVEKIKGPFRVDLGTWTIDEIQVCEMGSHGPNDEYVSVGSVSLLS